MTHPYTTASRTRVYFVVVNRGVSYELDLENGMDAVRDNTDTGGASYAVLYSSTIQGCACRRNAEADKVFTRLAFHAHTFPSAVSIKRDDEIGVISILAWFQIHLLQGYTTGKALYLMESYCARLKQKE